MNHVDSAKFIYFVRLKISTVHFPEKLVSYVAYENICYCTRLDLKDIVLEIVKG